MDAHLVNLLSACGAESHERRVAVEYELECLQNTNLEQFLSSLSNILLNTSNDIYVRQLSGILLKNAISSKDKNVDREKANKWQSIDISKRKDIKDKILRSVNLVDNEKFERAEVSKISSQVLSKLIKIEMQYSSKNSFYEISIDEFFSFILHLISNAHYLVRCSALLCLKYLCEDLTEILEETCQNPLTREYCNKILTSVVQGMRDSNNKVKSTATKALYCVLIFAKENFFNQTERNFLMQVLCQNCAIDDDEVKIASFECFVQIVTEYYEFLDNYIDALATLTLKSIKEGNEQVAIPAMEFWSAICDEEIDLLYLENEGSNSSSSSLGLSSVNSLSSSSSSSMFGTSSLLNTPPVGSLASSDVMSSSALPITSSTLSASCSSSSSSIPSTVCKHFISQAKDLLIPVLLETLTKQESEDMELDTWTISMAAATCLTLCSLVLKDDVIPVVIDFVLKNFGSDDWKYREAAVLAFGCIMEGPSTSNLKPTVYQSFTNLCQVLSDKSVAVRDTAAWTIGRILNLHPDITCLMIENANSNTNQVFRNPESYPQLPNTVDPSGGKMELFNGNINDLQCSDLMKVVISKLRDAPRVAVNICWVISSIADNIENMLSNSEKSYKLSTPIDTIFPFLCDELIFVTNRSDEENRCLREAAYNCLGSLIKCVGTSCTPIIEELLLHFLTQLENSFLFAATEETKTIQGCICGCLQCIITKLGPNIFPSAARIWTCIHKILIISPAELSEDALLTASALVTALGSNFEPFAADLSKIVIVGLSKTEDVQTCKICIDLVGDMCRALGKKFTPCSKGIVERIYTALSDPLVDRTLKPIFMIAIGDISMAINVDFSGFTDLFMDILSQAALTSIEMGPIDNEEWISYIADLRNGVLQAYSGIVYGMKEGNLLSMLETYVPTMLKLIEIISETPDQFLKISNLKSAIALAGDLATVFGERLCVVLMNSDCINKLILRANTYRNNNELLNELRWLEQILRYFRGPKGNETFKAPA